MSNLHYVLPGGWLGRSRIVLRAPKPRLADRYDIDSGRRPPHQESPRTAADIPDRERFVQLPAPDHTDRAAAR